VKRQKTENSKFSKSHGISKGLKSHCRENYKSQTKSIENAALITAKRWKRIAPRVSVGFITQRREAVKRRQVSSGPVAVSRLLLIILTTPRLRMGLYASTASRLLKTHFQCSMFYFCNCLGSGFLIHLKCHDILRTYQK